MYNVCELRTMLLFECDAAHVKSASIENAKAGCERDLRSREQSFRDICLICQ